MPLFLACLLIVIIAYIWGAVRRKRYIKKVKKDPELTVATITLHKGIRYSVRNNIWFYYHYTVNGKIYKGRTRNYLKLNYKENFKFIYGLTFPFVYSKSKPHLGRILINQKDFKDYGLTQPEELKEYNKKLM